jgi:PTH1 family peptidyl-tRNA hydrolase
VGFEVADELARRWSISLAAEKFHAWFGAGDFRGVRVGLMKPSTYMNRSGQAVLAAGQFYKIEPSDLMVVVDDHALPLGKLRIRKSGSAGGHNGLDDIITRVGSDAWCRLRMGIGEPVGDRKDYVTGAFGESEKPVMAAAVTRAADAVECWVAEGPDAAMNKFNVEAG